MRLVHGRIGRQFLFLLVLFLGTHALAWAETRQQERFGDWLRECSAPQGGKTFCALTQTAQDRDTGSRVMKLTLGRYGPRKELALVALLPLGIYLPAGVQGRVDQAPPFALTLRTCVAQGCEAAIAVDPKLRWRLRAGKTLNISFVARPGAQRINLPFSLDQVWAGLKAIGER